MHAPSQFLFDDLQPRPHAVTSGLPFDLEFTPASFAADEGEAIDVIRCDAKERDLASSPTNHPMALDAGSGRWTRLL